MLFALPELYDLFTPLRHAVFVRLESLRIVHRVHTQERDNVQSGLAQSKRSTEELENRSSDSQISKLNNKYTFMQQVRSYVRDLLDCFNEKVNVIISSLLFP